MEVVRSKSLGLATDIELDSKGNRRRAEEEKRRKGDERARRRSVEEQARRREAQVKRQEAALERAKAQRLRGEAETRRQPMNGPRRGVKPRKVSRPVQSVEVFRDRLRSGG